MCSQINTLVCPPEKHISVETAELKAAIKNRLALADRAVFDDLCKLMSGVAEFDFVDLASRIRTNFLPFASGAKHQIYLQRNSKNLPTTASLDKKEEEFLADVYEVGAPRCAEHSPRSGGTWVMMMAQQGIFNASCAGMFV